MPKQNLSRLLACGLVWAGLGVLADCAGFYGGIFGRKFSRALHHGAYLYAYIFGRLRWHGLVHLGAP